MLPVISMAVDSGDGSQSKVLIDDKDSVFMAEKNVAQCVEKVELSISLGLQNLQRRVSPRLQNMPDDQKPFYGSNRKRLSNGLKDKVSEKGIKVEFVEDIRCKDNVVTAKKNGAQCVEKIEPNSSQGLQNLQRRVSPRLQNIPDDQKPFYGSNRKRLSDGLKDKVSEKGIKVEFVEDIRCKENVVTAKKSVAQCVEKIEPNSSQGRKNLQQRISPRLQNIPDDQKPFYGSNRKRLSDGLEEKVSNKRTKVVFAEDIRCGSDLATGHNSCLAQVDNSDKSVARVKRTLRVFNRFYLRFVQEEEKRCKKPKDNDMQVSNGSENNNGNASDDYSRRCSKRPDLKAISEMVKSNKILYPKKIGHLPGIDIGHQFFSRAEMVAVGLHGHWLTGIDYIGESCKMKEYQNFTLPLAVSIVLSGQYEDDVDNSEEVVYTGQGGNNLLGNKRQIKDQVMCRGNLALKNNMDQDVCVRVIRGHKCASSYTRKVYTYDGLYKVDHFWKERGVAGFIVFKYRLKRIEGQPKLVTHQVDFAWRRVSKGHFELDGLVCRDICGGQENICIPATNVCDVPPVVPAGFKYIKSVQVAENVIIPPDAPGCNCKGKCTNAAKCYCAQLNGDDFPYVNQDGGRLVEPTDVVFECGPRCGCGPSCLNRTSQQGLKYELEVYRTENKGWAVRSRDFIPSGAPVCEYVGILRKNDELDNVSGNDYIFDIDCWQTMNEIGGRERRLRDVSLPLSGHAEERHGKISENGPEFCIDAGSYGNVARFINHSCEPNLFVQCVLSSHHDVRLARVILFAADNIPPMQCYK
ncbi:histone-lysine N-methyltransferase, H3 lysine-9 specific SUVH4-like isoform X2 [Alnus glutinosa]|uniref:histone-lysine N-methyltransferase, H3 lysine-9 specific SUVH4-like isoform X2 n=1 Tax=Alnus glutinosa TaxID=3517 RepID=UPI002D77858A|nr:histone-lysine N-methyltransferase, H3 lysine-9 specific SUVH4-like isoform X2 [Alnus glutinosa]